jgi:hypothetical protein
MPFQLQETEQVILLLRRHWIHLYPRLALLLAVAVLPPLVLWLVANAIGDVDGALQLVLLVVTVAWVAFWLFRTYLLWYRYEHDIWVLTTQRLVDSFKRHWFHHQMSSADLIDIEDVSVERHGLLQTFFNYGDVQVQTAAQERNFLVGSVPDPRQVLATIDATRDEARREYRMGI